MRKSFFEYQTNFKILVISTSAGDNTETTLSKAADEMNYGQQSTLWKVGQKCSQNR
jgi:hypothetical protein